MLIDYIKKINNNVLLSFIKYVGVMFENMWHFVAVRVGVIHA
jgi:hypothetical protein